MNINSILKKEGIEPKNKLDNTQVKKIANIISQKICDTFPEHNLEKNNIFNLLENLTMYIAKMPDNSAIAKYFALNNSIYFNTNMDFENIDTLVIHECIHAIQTYRNQNGKVSKLGLYDLNTNKGQGINEASVQLMATKASALEKDNVKYFNMNFNTESPIFYPIETALINEMIYFTGTYPLFHSTLYSNNVFKNTFIAKTSEKVYNTIESNFDLLIHYEELLSLTYAELANHSNINANEKKLEKINAKINKIKTFISNLTISTQNLIIENCFNSEFELIKDLDSLNLFRKKLYDFNEILISTENYDFYTNFYYNMMNKLDEKSELIKKYGVLTYLNDLQTDLLNLEKDNYGFKFFHKLFDKLKLLFEEAVREKN